MPACELVPLIDQNVLNLPDIQFADWCLQQYGVNRGVYNTIDQWLFQNGFEPIILRRKQLILFLQQVTQSAQAKKQTGGIKLGKGVLIPALLAFVEQEAIAHSGLRTRYIQWKS